MLENKKYELIIVGGGTSGVSAAIGASKQGIKTLIVEKEIFLGGAMTGGLVIPMMNNISNRTIVLDEILEKLHSTKNAITYSDGNNGWFNPEMMKCVLDDLCVKYDVNVLFGCELVDVKRKNSSIDSIECSYKGQKITLNSDYFIDATGDATLSYLSNIPFEIGDNGNTQPCTLRFNMSNIDLKTFTDWLLSIDDDASVTSRYVVDGQLHFTTAYTFEDKNWALKPIFMEGINEGLINESEAKYFQIFSIAGQPTSVAFNCPRIDMEVNPLSPFDTSNAIIEGRKSIRNIAEFCRQKFPGFKDAHVSNIATSLGIRDSRRIKGRYTLTEDNLGETQNSCAFKSNYPFDIHSNNSKESILSDNLYYEVSQECLMPKGINNLLVVGRCISANFKMQSSLRIQRNCFAMGEYAGNFIAQKLNTKSN